MTLSLNGLCIDPLDHPYNVTADNERCVEVPLALEFLGSCPGSVLEVGNVLSHYADVAQLPERVVVDLNERAVDERGAPVLNVDVCSWTPPALFDRIVAVSTIEHVGWDVPVPHPFAAEAAIHRLRSWLAPGGRALVTVPLGYHPPLDAALGRLEALSAVLVRHGRLSWRTAPAERWEFATVAARAEFVRRFPYDRSIPSATGLWVGEFSRPST